MELCNNFNCKKKKKISTGKHWACQSIQNHSLRAWYIGNDRPDHGYGILADYL